MEKLIHVCGYSFCNSIYPNIVQVVDAVLLMDFSPSIYEIISDTLSLLGWIESIGGGDPLSELQYIDFVNI